MPPILKRLKKPSEAEPDLATLLEPYGTPEGGGAEQPADAPASNPSEREEES